MSFGKRKIPKRLILEDYYQQKRSYGLGWLLLAAALLVFSMCISIKVAADSEIYETEAGQLMLKNSSGLFEPSLHLNSAVDAVINGMVAEVTLSQVFSNHTDQWQEGVYVFPLPENAGVNHMQMRIGERVIVGEIKEKQQARKIYQQAKSAGKRAALTEQKRPNIFSQRVANIAPQQKIEISITYIQTIDYDRGEFSWRMPMTITPRFYPRHHTDEEKDQHGRVDLKKSTRSEEISGESNFAVTHFINSGWATNENGFIDNWALPASTRRFLSTPTTNPVRLNLRLNSGLPLADIRSLFHQVNISKKSESHSIRFAKDSENMNRDFVLRWRPSDDNRPQAALFSEEVDNEFYSLLMLIPPYKKTLPHERLARDIVFIIDVSGSMSGTSITQAKAGLLNAIDRLGPNDRFNIVAFSNNYHALFPTLHDTQDHHISAAKRWVGRLESRGGTNMLPALNFAFEQYAETHSLQQTIFITDGAVGNERELFKNIRERMGDSRLFTVGIGSAPNSFFMRKAAAFGRGTFTYIGDIRHVEEKIDGLFSKLDSAVAKNIHINWPGNVTLYPEKIPDLYFSEPLLIAAKSTDLSGIVEIAGETALQYWQQKISLKTHKNAQGVSSIWARKKIEDLEDLKVSGGNVDVLQAEITEVALRHKILSAYTSFVAVEQELSRPDEKALVKTPVQNALPAGFKKRSQAVAYPQTATHAEISWWLGLFFVMLLILVLRMVKE